MLSLSKRRRRTSTAEDKLQRTNQAVSVKQMESSQRMSSEDVVKDQNIEKENKNTNKTESDSHRERKRLKKRKREKLKEKLQHESKKKKRKHRCNDENCKHKRHHKKHRKHKKHHHNKEAEVEVKPEDVSEVPEAEDDEGRETEDEQQDSFEETSEEFAEYEVIGNPEDEVTMDDILEDKKKVNIVNSFSFGSIWNNSLLYYYSKVIL